MLRVLLINILHNIQYASRTRKTKLDKKAKVNFKIITVITLQTGRQIITIYILPNISRYKGKQRMKFGQLIT